MGDRIEVPGVVPGQQGDRPGYEIHIPGECLKPGSCMWSDAQREAGIWLRMVYLTSSEEEEVILEASRAGLVLANTFQVRRSIQQMADSSLVQIEQADGVVTQPAPGPFKKIAVMDRRAFWEEIGGVGRSIALLAFNLANTPSEAARVIATASFRVTG